MPSHKITSAWENVGTNEMSEGQVTVTAELGLALDATLTAEQEDKQHDLAIDVSALKSLFLKSTTGVEIKTNDANTPDDTITLAAGEALVWHAGSPLPSPFPSETDVTALYITNLDDAAGAVTLRGLVDPTP